MNTVRTLNEHLYLFPYIYAYVEKERDFFAESAQKSKFFVIFWLKVSRLFKYFCNFAPIFKSSLSSGQTTWRTAKATDMQSIIIMSNAGIQGGVRLRQRSFAHVGLICERGRDQTPLLYLIKQ